jgi:hypothetical protein
MSTSLGSADMGASPAAKEVGVGAESPVTSGRIDLGQSTVSHTTFTKLSGISQQKRARATPAPTSDAPLQDIRGSAPTPIR